MSRALPTTSCPRGHTRTARPHSARPWCLGAIGAAVALVLVPAAHASDNDKVLQEVVVTAQKRAQNVQNIPMSVSVLDASQLDSMGAKNFEDFARDIPGLELANLGAGQNRIVIRGVSTFSGTSVVGIYLDDSPIDSAINYSQPSLALYDVERVEVLKGPQGTLYGEDSLGGTIRYITADPDPSKVAAKTEATVSNTEKGGTNYDFEGMVNLPVIADTAAVRLVAVHEYGSGYIDNIPLHNSNFNDITTDAFRAKTLWKATENLAIELTGFYQKIAQGGPNIESFDAPLGSLENFDTAPESYADKLSQGALKITYDLPFATLTSATSYFARQVAQDSQDRGTAFNPPFPFYAIEALNFHTFTEETRLVSNGNGPFNWLAGVYYNDNHTTAGYNYYNTTPSGRHLSSSIQNNQFKQYAVYGQTEYAFTSNLFGTLGLRWFKENNYALTAAGRQFSVQADGAIPRFALRYVLNPQAMVYTSISEGFRSGGVNLYSIPGVNNTYAPDKTWNYELGTKLTDAARRLSADISVYYIDWRDLQTFVFRPDVGPFAFFVENVSAARVDGAELQLDWRPELVPGLALGGSTSYANARYTKNAPFEGPAGNQLPQVPHWTGSAYAEYGFPLTAALQGYARADYQYYGTFYTLGNNRVTGGNYTLGNLRLGVDGGKWSLEIFADNLWDTRANLYSQSSAAFGIYRNRPRTVGLTARWHY